MTRQIRIGLIGHKFMGKAHSHALRDLSMFFPMDVDPIMQTLCGLGDDLEDTARRYGWLSTTHSWEAVVEDPAIDVVAIATPGNTHCEIALAAASRKKHILCEKPLAMTASEALRMYRAAEQNGIRNVVNFNYRRLPAVMLAKRLIEEGRLGQIYYFRGTYFQDWPLDPAFPFLWRMDKQVAGAGSMADKGSHIVDLARYLVAEFEEVAATTEIFVKERPVAGEVGTRSVTTDDAAAFLARFANGALGLFGTSRMSAGHKNSLGFEVNGSQGSLIFDLERLNELQVYFAAEPAEVQGFRTVMATGPGHAYGDRWWPPGHVLGWEHSFIHQYYELLRSVAEDIPSSPSFHDGLKAQQVLEAIEQASAEKRWVAVAKVE